MKLFKDILIRRFEVMKDLELNGENFKSIWHFYQIYKLSLNFMGLKDPNLNVKEDLIRRLIINPDNFPILVKLREYMAVDYNLIEKCFGDLSYTEEVVEVEEDFYPTSVFAVNIYERGV